MKDDIVQFISEPDERLKAVNYAKHSIFKDRYQYRPPVSSLGRVDIDWENKKLIADSPSKVIDTLEQTFFKESRPVSHDAKRYRKWWYGKIFEHFSRNEVKIVLFQVPRDPLASIKKRPPLSDDIKQDGLIAYAKSFKNIHVLPENTFHSLEDPTLFRDMQHLNRKGQKRFTNMLVKYLSLIHI